MEDNTENVGSFFVKLVKMLYNPEDYDALSVEIMCATLNVFYKRLITYDALYILDEDISNKEYTKYFKDIIEHYLPKNAVDGIKKNLKIEENE